MLIYAYQYISHLISPHLPCPPFPQSVVSNGPQERSNSPRTSFISQSLSPQSSLRVYRSASCVDPSPSSDLQVQPWSDLLSSSSPIRHRALGRLHWPRHTLSTQTPLSGQHHLRAVSGRPCLQPRSTSVHLPSTPSRSEPL